MTTDESLSSKQLQLDTQTVPSELHIHQFDVDEAASKRKRLEALEEQGRTRIQALQGLRNFLAINLRVVSRN